MMKHHNDNQDPSESLTTRRTFLRQATAGTLAMAVARGAAGAEAGRARRTIQGIRAATLQYVESMRLHDGPYGRYRYATGMPGPTLYSSTYAAMTRGLYHDLGSLTTTQRREWIGYLQSHQDDDGLYRDPAIFGEGWYRGDPEWCGRRHLTCHVVTALTCLGSVAARPLRFLEPFYEQRRLVEWLEARDWQKVDYVGNEVLNLGTLLQYARDFQKEIRATVATRTLLEWLGVHHVRPETGLWGQTDTKAPKGLSRAVMGAYHFWLLFFYDRTPIPQSQQAIDQVLRTENPQGGFGWGVHGPRSSACEDIDSIDPLARLLFLSAYRRKDVHGALEHAVSHVLGNQNADGGFVFVRGREFSYGHPLMSAGRDASAMFPTWFRTLSLAYLGKSLPGSIVGGFDWQFTNCPGIQFWLQST